MSETIQRWETFVGTNGEWAYKVYTNPSNLGPWVKHSDHLAALSAKDRELEKAVFALRQKDAAMDEYARIVARMDTALKERDEAMGKMADEIAAWRRVHEYNESHPDERLSYEVTCIPYASRATDANPLAYLLAVEAARGGRSEHGH